MINPKSRTARALEIIYDGLINKDYDDVLCIVGDEGKGKSNILLHIIEWWMLKRYGRIEEEDVKKHVAMDAKSFSKILSNVKQYDIVADDEAADISSRGAMQRTNQLFMKAYQIIRGDNLFTILVIPSLFDLDTFFRKRRVKHLIHVYKRGKYAFWSNKRLQRMVEMNERFPIKNYYVVRPTFFDSLPKYEGVLKTGYDKIKAKKMKEVRKNLAKEMADQDYLIREACDLYKEGLTLAEIAEKQKVSERTAARRTIDVRQTDK